MKVFFGLFFIACLLIHKEVAAQKLNANGGLMFKGTIVFGNQNQYVQIGAFGFGALNYGDLSIESGVSFVSYQFVKRHTKKISGLGFSYEGFTLVGIGNNTNLLGSSVSKLNHEVFFNPNEKGRFIGMGFGFSKAYLPNKLKSYGIKNGQFLMRFSNNTHSTHVVFTNDFKVGKLFNGERTDYATTGSFYVEHTSANRNRIYQAGVGLALFTPQPDYTRSPRNPLNSDDGRKNVWYTLPPFKDIFYANLYGYGAYQNANYAVSSQLGINSQRLGAFVQNTLHDGVGLNPRFPWDVTQKDQLFIETTGSITHSINSNHE